MKPARCAVCKAPATHGVEHMPGGLGYFAGPNCRSLCWCEPCAQRQADKTNAADREYEATLGGQAALL